MQDKIKDCVYACMYLCVKSLKRGVSFYGVHVKYIGSVLFLRVALMMAGVTGAGVKRAFSQKEMSFWKILFFN